MSEEMIKLYKNTINSIRELNEKEIENLKLELHKVTEECCKIFENNGIDRAIFEKYVKDCLERNELEYRLACIDELILANEEQINQNKQDITKYTVKKEKINANTSLSEEEKVAQIAKLDEKIHLLKEQNKTLEEQNVDYQDKIKPINEKLDTLDENIDKQRIEIASELTSLPNEEKEKFKASSKKLENGMGLIKNKQNNVALLLSTLHSNKRLEEFFNYQQNKKEKEELKEENNRLKEELKNKKIGTKISNAKGKVRKKVVAVKQFVKENKGKTIALISLIAIAGLIGSTITMGNPLGWAARGVSALWHPLHRIGLGEPLHGINQFLFGKLNNATFDPGKGTWINAAGKVLNDLSAFEEILGWVGGIGLTALAGYGIYKGIRKAAPHIKNLWVKIAEGKFAQGLIGKIKALGGKGHKRKPRNLRKIEKDFNEIYQDATVEELAEIIEELQNQYTLKEHGQEVDKDYEDYTLDELECMINAAKKMLKNKSKGKDNKEDKDKEKKLTDIQKQELLKLMAEMKQEDLEKYIEKLNEHLEHWKDGWFDDEFKEPIEGVYNIEDLGWLYEQAQRTYTMNFGNRKR